MTKEEKKDELKNRISMALKDPILQQGFEIICKNLTELENKIADIKANCDLAIEGRDIKIAELTDRVEDLQEQNSQMFNTIALQEQQIEKLIDFVLSKTECCDVCPITDTCVNSEGTCPYVGILAKGEEEVTREWLMQFISRR